MDRRGYRGCVSVRQILFFWQDWCMDTFEITLSPYCSKDDVPSIQQSLSKRSREGGGWFKLYVDKSGAAGFHPKISQVQSENFISPDIAIFPNLGCILQRCYGANSKSKCPLLLQAIPSPSEK